MDFLASVVLLATGAPRKWFCQRVQSAQIPSLVSSSDNRSEVDRFSNVMIDSVFTSHFSIKPNIAFAPWPRLVSTPQYGSAWNRYPSNKVMNQS